MQVGCPHSRPAVRGAIRFEALIGLLSGILVVMVFTYIIFKSFGRANDSTLNETAEASITLGQDKVENGLKLLNMGDGQVTVTQKDGLSCVRLGSRYENYIYFALDRRFKTSSHLNAMLHVEFLASGRGLFDVQFDGYKFGESRSSIYSDTPVGIQFDILQHWHKVSLPISNARFGNRQSNGADFRLRVRCPSFYVRSVKLTDIEDAPQTTSQPAPQAPAAAPYTIIPRTKER